MVRLPKESQPSRSSLRVATVRSLKDGAQSCDTSSTGKVKKPPRTGPAVSIASKQSAAPPPLVDPAIDVPKGQSLSNVPRLDRPWVIYDLSGKSFIVKPSRAGIETSTVSDPVGNDRLLQSAGNEYAGGVSCLDISTCPCPYCRGFRAGSSSTRPGPNLERNRKKRYARKLKRASFIAEKKANASSQ